MVTLRDVAIDAGVSVTTASRVLSGSRTVREENVEAVLRSAEKLGYRTHQVARALRRQSTETVGVIVPVISNPFFPLLVQEIERRLHHAHGLAVLLCDSQDEPSLERERVQALLDRQVDALLMVPCHLELSAVSVERAAAALPVVQVDRRVGGARADVVSVDHAAGIEMAVDHVVGRGRRRIALVGGALTNAAALDRSNAFRRRVRGHGLVTGSLLAGEYTMAWGRRAALRLLEMDTTPDAIVCGNDLIAIGVVEALRDAGVTVPDDIAVTGFDGLEFTGIIRPGITTVAQPIERIAERATALLLRRVQGHQGSPRVELLEPELIVRDSSGDGA